MTNTINMNEVFASGDARKAAAEAVIAQYSDEQVAEASRVASIYDRCSKTSIKHRCDIARILAETTPAPKAAPEVVELTVADYSENYGGVPVIIDGRECHVGSVVGYALYNKEDPVEAVADHHVKAKAFPYHGHKLVWINLCGTTISGDAGFYERQAAKRAAMPKLSTGSLIRFEGKTYRIVGAPNNNFALIPVTL